MPSDEFPSIAWAESIVPTKNRGRLFPATMYRRLLPFTNFTVTIPIVIVMHKKPTTPAMIGALAAARSPVIMLPFP